MRLPGIPSNGQLTDSDCIRVRICEGRFALLIREVGKKILFSPSFICLYLRTCISSVSVLILFSLNIMLSCTIQPIREGNFIIQPKVDFDISITTVAGLLNLG
jgi:hypothetical protein